VSNVYFSIGTFLSRGFLPKLAPQNAQGARKKNCPQMSKPAMVIFPDPRLREWESGNYSFPFLRTLREWEGQWGIRQNFARERNFFLRIASKSQRQFASKNHDFSGCSSLSKMSVYFF